MQLKQDTFLQNGKYKIEQMLRQGGFGITYLATQVLLDRKVCIKEFFFKEYCERDEATSHITLGTQSSHEIVERFMSKFLKEARTISQLDHPNIIRIHDIFMENNTAYYVMEYIEGESLSDIVNKHGALPEAKAIDYIRQVADALDFVHKRSINHLDVKPANIMVRHSDNKAILIDFGLSKQYDEQGGQTSTTPVGISHGYAPMEQYKQGGVSTFSPQTDIYALGATLFKLVTGNTPPQAMDILDEGLPSLPSSVSTSVTETIKTAMQPRKLDRPKSITELLDTLSSTAPKASQTYPEKQSNQSESTDEETKIVEDSSIISDKVAENNETAKAWEPVTISVGKEKKKKNWLKWGIIALICIISIILIFPRITQLTRESKIESLFNSALEYYSNNDYINAIPLFQKGAMYGDNYSEVLLAMCYILSETDVQGGLKILERQASYNNAEAQYQLGIAYTAGVGIEPDPKQAFYWWLRCAEQGVGSAQYLVGECYYYGNGVTRDLESAKKWLNQSASQGYNEALNLLFFINAEEATITNVKTVDLGLSVLWAGWNIGASSPNEYGGLYRYGDPFNQITSWDSEACPNYDIVNTNKDIAKANWGNEWRMPTMQELQELIDNCIFIETTYKGVKGSKVVGPNGNCIFLPFAGTMYNYGRSQAGDFGNYASGELDKSNPMNIRSLYINEEQPTELNYSRGSGYSVRAVKDKTNN